MDRLVPQPTEQHFTDNSVTVNYTVFTMPYQLRPQCMNKEFMRKLRARVYQMLADKHGADCAFEATHPWGDKDPMEFHPHLNFLWIQRKGFSHYLNLQQLRADYADILGYQGEPYIYHEYSNLSGTIWKWCEYVARTFPEFSKWCGHTKWFGNYRRKPEKECHKCAKCGAVYRPIGWIAAHLIMEYELLGSKFGPAPPWENNDNIVMMHTKDQTTQHVVNAKYYSNL
jgi:hypothetical protein